MWCIVVIGTKHLPIVYGPIGNFEQAKEIEGSMTRMPWTKSIHVLPMTAIEFLLPGEL